MWGASPYNLWIDPWLLRGGIPVEMLASAYSVDLRYTIWQFDTAMFFLGGDDLPI